LKKLSSKITDPEALKERMKKILSSDIHGLRRCSCCKRVYNRDHIAYQNIGDKALSLWSGKEVAAPFNRSKYSKVAHSLEQKLGTQESSSSSSSSAPSRNIKKRKRKEDSKTKQIQGK
jgi:hypothetical protein